MSSDSPTRNCGNGPLAGIKVLDLSQVYLGPYATFLMAKAGADVIKVEPLQGEPARRRADVGKSATFPFCMLNANKQSVTLNLKDEDGRALLIEMVKRADILVENFAPGVMDRLGVGWEVLHATNPRLIYASGTGYGLSGPDRDTLAMDLTVQAMSGVMSVTGEPDGPPLKAGPAFVDFISGVHLYGAVMTALYEREKIGRGRLVEVAMQDAVVPTMASNLGLMHNNPGATAGRTGNRHGGLSISPYNVYPCRDGYVAIICMAENHWLALCKAFAADDILSDPRFENNARRVENMQTADEIVKGWTMTKTRQELLDLARKFRFLCAPVRDLVEVMSDRHLMERGMLEWVDHPELGRVVLPNSPLRFHGTEPIVPKPSHKLGADNSDVYRSWLGLSPDRIAALRAAGTI